MPTYEHVCLKCSHEWEDFYSISADPPDTCPECEAKGQVKRLISGGSGKGIVELTGRELKEHLQSEGKKLGQQAKRSENFAANIEGEGSYHNRQLAIDRLKRL